MDILYIKLIILFVSFVIIVYFTKKIFFSKNESIKQESSNNDYLVKNDPNAQTLYEKTKVNFFSLENIKNKLELSWEFLYEITEIVLKRFSSQDRGFVHKLGKTLLNAGMQYNHVIDYSIDLEKIKQQAKDKNKSSQKVNR
jgi:hypothetical protein